MTAAAGDPDRPRVTLFVFAYKQEATVRAAIAAAFAQTYSPLEILLSDDASPDATFAAMEETAARYDGPHAVVLNRNPENLGVVAHIDRIVARASGRLLVQNGADDLSEPDRVAALVAAWRDSGPPGARAALVHSAARRIDAAGRPRDVIRPAPALGPGADPAAFLRGNGYVIGATEMWDRRLHDRFGPLAPVAPLDDRPLAFRALLDGGIAYVDRPLLRYRAGGVSEKAGDPAAELKYRRWYAGCHRSYLRDLDRADPALRARLEPLAAAGLRRHAFHLAVAERGTAGRLALIPEALALALGARDLHPLRDLARHLAGARR